MDVSSLLSSISIHKTLGALLVGFAASCVAFGVLSMQCFTYFMKYPLDKPGYKFLVAVIWIFELADQALIGHLTYFYIIVNFFTPTNIIIGDVVWSLIVQVVLGNVVGTVVKLCFAIRVWRFSGRNIPITGLIIALTLGQFALAIVYTVKAFELNKLYLAERLKLIASLSLGAGALTDLVIAGALTFFLRRLRTGYRPSDSLVNGLTRYAINTGAFTSAISIATLVSYDVSPQTFIFMAFYFVLSKLYAISFVCTLNTRRIVRGRGTDREGNTSTSGRTHLDGNTFYMVSHHGRTGRSNSQSMGHTKSQLEIGIHQEVSVVSDVDESQYEAQKQAPGRA